MFKRILFIGLGGAGQRHLRLFKKNVGRETELIAFRKTSKTPVLNADFTVNQIDSLEELYGVKIFESLEKAISSKPDLAVISTPSSFHMDYAIQCAEKGINIFIEKPLAHNLDNFKKLEDLILKMNLVQTKEEPEADILNVQEAAKLLNLRDKLYTCFSNLVRVHD